MVYWKFFFYENRNLLDDTQIKVVDETVKKKDNEKSILDNQTGQLNEKTITVRDAASDYGEFLPHWPAKQSKSTG